MLHIKHGVQRSLTQYLELEPESQYLSESVDRETLALRRLCAAMIVRALRDLDSGVKEIRRTAYYWLFLSVNSKITLQECCTILGMDIKDLRRTCKLLKPLPKHKLSKLISPKGYKDN